MGFMEIVKIGYWATIVVEKQNSPKEVQNQKICYRALYAAQILFLSLKLPKANFYKLHSPYNFF